MRQCCVLSPLLFCLFIADLPGWLDADEVGGVSFGLSLLQSLLFADDLALLAESESALQSMLDSLEKYCSKWRAVVNAGKTEVVVFQKRERTDAPPQVTYRGELIKVSSSFKYLGVVLESTGAWKTAVQARATKAVGAFHLFVRRCTAWMLSPDTSERLYKTFVLPVLLYGCELWGTKAWPPLEAVQVQVALHVLGVQRAVSHAAVCRELGWLPIQAQTAIRAVRYWLSVAKRTSVEPSSLLAEAFRVQWELVSRGAGYTWLASVISLLRTTLGGESERFISAVRQSAEEQSFLFAVDLGAGEHREKWEQVLEKALVGAYSRQQHEKLQQSSKTRLYSQVLENPWSGAAGYLSLLQGKQRYVMSCLVRIRLGGTPLMIERGRYEQRRTPIRSALGEITGHIMQSTPPQARICPLCAQGVEDEAHFLCVCATLNCLRARILPDAWPSPAETTHAAYLRLMHDAASCESGGRVLWTAIARFCAEALHLRESLLSRQQRISS